MNAIIRTMSCIVAVLLALPSPTAAAVPLQVPLQGALRDNAGAPVSEGTFEMTFTLYRDAEGTDAAWSETRTVDVQGGLFRAMLGDDGESVSGLEGVVARWIHHETLILRLDGDEQNVQAILGNRQHLVESFSSPVCG